MVWLMETHVKRFYADDEFCGSHFTEIKFTRFPFMAVLLWHFWLLVRKKIIRTDFIRFYFIKILSTLDKSFVWNEICLNKIETILIHCIQWLFICFSVFFFKGFIKLHRYTLILILTLWLVIYLFQFREMIKQVIEAH